MTKLLDDGFAQMAREWLHYDPETGTLVWKKTRSPRALEGAPAGSISTLDYHVIVLGPYKTTAARVAFMLAHNRWPKGQVLLKDRNRANLKLDNLIERGNPEYTNFTDPISYWSIETWRKLRRNSPAAPEWQTDYGIQAAARLRREDLLA